MADLPSVYLETSFISYLATGLQGNFSADVDIAARQVSSCIWWQQYRDRFTLFVSGVVYEECWSGNEGAAQSRLAILAQAATLTPQKEIMDLTSLFVEPSGPLPKKAEADAAHIAFATVYGCEYLLTWNFKHIGNAILQRSIYKIASDYGYQPTHICTPDELSPASISEG